MSGSVSMWWVHLPTLKLRDRVRTDVGDIDELEQSILDRGLLQPLVVNREKQLLAGYRRYVALRRLGWDRAPAVVVDTIEDAAEALRVERDENVCRKDFTPSEAVELGRRLEELERPKAAARQEATRAQPGEKANERQGGGNFPPPTPSGKSRDVVGAAVGMSGRTYDKARSVVDAAADPDLPEQVRDTAAAAVAEMDRTGKVDPAFRKVSEARDLSVAEVFGDEAAAELAASKLAKNAARLRQQVFTGVLALDPERVALVTSEELGEWHLWQSMRERINEWCDRLEAARPKPFTVVEGGRS